MICIVRSEYGANVLQPLQVELLLVGQAVLADVPQEGLTDAEVLDKLGDHILDMAVQRRDARALVVAIVVVLGVCLGFGRLLGQLLHEGYGCDLVEVLAGLGIGYHPLLAPSLLDTDADVRVVHHIALVLLPVLLLLLLVLGLVGRDGRPGVEYNMDCIPV